LAAADRAALRACIRVADVVLTIGLWWAVFVENAGIALLTLLLVTQLKGQADAAVELFAGEVPGALPLSAKGITRAVVVHGAHGNVAASRQTPLFLPGERSRSIRHFTVPPVIAGGRFARAGHRVASWRVLCLQDRARRPSRALRRTSTQHQRRDAQEAFEARG